jgi:peptidoglycan/LPS O-acetylase OafA/YrhL
MPFHQPNPVFFISIWICLIILLCTQHGWLSNILFENPIVMYLGKISYSIYLTHFLVINALPVSFDGMLKFIIGLACTVGISSVTYFFIEEPFIKYSKRLVA